MRHFILASALFAAAAGFAPTALSADEHAAHSATAPAAGPSSIQVTGPAGTVTVTAAEIAAMPHVKVDVVWHGKPASFYGVALSDVLAKVGAPQGETLRDKALNSVVVVAAADGYKVVLSLAETDAGVKSGKVIIADAMDGAPLGAGDGPLRLVIEGDLKPARSARMLSSIVVKSVD